MKTYSPLYLSKAVRKIYRLLNINYSLFIPLDLLEKEEVTLDEVFPLELVEKVRADLDRVNVSDDENEELLFSKNFNFKRDNRGVAQIKYGQKKLASRVKSLTGDETSNVLSLGIGDGKVASEYAKELNAESQITGIDLHQNYLDSAKVLIPNLRTEEFDLNTIATGKKLNFHDNSIDIVECSMAAHHVKDLESLINEVLRVLKDDGEFVYLDLVDHTKLEEKMTNSEIHTYPDYHGIEFFRSHEQLVDILKKDFEISEYERIGPGILYVSARKK